MSSNDRAAAAAQAVTERHLRRMMWLPGTRLAAVSWPFAPIASHFGMWHYWWHAHLVDLLVDAAIHRPPGNEDFDHNGARTVDALLRGIHLRNLGRWTNNYYDDMAWLGLAVERADRHLELHHQKALHTLTSQMLDAWVPQLGGGIPWRKTDLFFNAPANGPAAILVARTGHIDRAREMSDWMDATLVDSSSHLILDGVKPRGRGEPMEPVTAIYTYCQGVVLGTEVELLRRTGDRVHLERLERLLGAVETHECPDGIIRGAGGGDGGLFMGILARYLALVATDLPDVDGADDLRARAGRIVITSADAAWAGRVDTADGPLFSADWHRTAEQPGRDGGKAQFIGGAVNSSSIAERDLSVQLSGWMVFEAATAVDLRLREHDQKDPA